jgi:hypothetical protein
MDFAGFISFLDSFQGKETSPGGGAPQADAGKDPAELSLNSLEFNIGNFGNKGAGI